MLESLRVTDRTSRLTQTTAGGMSDLAETEDRRGRLASTHSAPGVSASAVPCQYTASEVTFARLPMTSPGQATVYLQGDLGALPWVPEHLFVSTYQHFPLCFVRMSVSVFSWTRASQLPRLTRVISKRETLTSSLRVLWFSGSE